MKYLQKQHLLHSFNASRITNKQNVIFDAEFPTEKKQIRRARLRARSRL